MSLRRTHGTLVLLAALVGAGPLRAQDAASDAAVLTARDFASICADRTDGATEGVVAGLVTDAASGLPLPGTRLRVDWGEDLLPGQLRVGGDVAASSDVTWAMQEGIWFVCGVGQGEVRVEVSIGDSIYARDTFDMQAGTVRRVDFALPFSIPGAPTALFGYVTDAATGRPIPDAELTLIGEEGVRRSGPNGFFAFDSVRSGMHALEVRHLSYQDRVLPLLLQGGQAGEVEVSLASEAIEIEGLEVHVRSTRRMRGLGELERRKALDFGTFLDTDDLERYGAFYLGDALRRLPGAGARTLGYGATASYVLRRQGGYCRPAVFINGIRDRTPNALTWFSASQIAAVEMHRGPVVPPEFVTLDDQHLCGVISAWTR